MGRIKKWGGGVTIKAVSHMLLNLVVEALLSSVASTHPCGKWLPGYKQAMLIC